MLTRARCINISPGEFSSLGALCFSAVIVPFQNVLFRFLFSLSKIFIASAVQFLTDFHCCCTISFRHFMLPIACMAPCQIERSIIFFFKDFVAQIFHFLNLSFCVSLLLISVGLLPTDALQGQALSLSQPRIVSVSCFRRIFSPPPFLELSLVTVPKVLTNSVYSLRLII